MIVTDVLLPGESPIERKNQLVEATKVIHPNAVLRSVRWHQTGEPEDLGTLHLEFTCGWWESNPHEPELTGT